jgi:hypothetical protein
MVTFVCRFYGRFVLARERHNASYTGRVSMLAPNLFVPKLSGVHTPVLAISRGAVSSDPKKTTVEPTLRTIPGPKDIDAEFLLWNLSGTAVEVRATGGFTLKPKDPLLNLSRLEGFQKRTAVLDPTNLKPGDKVGATIAVAAGVGESRANFENSIHFIASDVAKAGGTTKTKTDDDAKQFADWFEVKIGVDGIVDSEGIEHADLELRLSGSMSGAIHINGVDGTQVSFSNLCNSCPRTARDFDIEFDGYYSLLTTTAENRLLPMVTHAGDDDCNESVAIDYDVREDTR